MTRHGKNSTASSVYTYHERRKDARQSGYGTLKMRLGSDSLNNFDCCHLTLQPAKDPVLTPEGFLYDKGSILEYIISVKKENARKMKEYEIAMEKISNKDDLAKKALHEKSIELLRAGACATSPSLHTSSSKQDSSSVSNMAGSKRKHLPSYWTPDQSDKRARLSEEDDMSGAPVKPDMKVYCPMSGKVLRAKDLIPVKFTPMPDDTQPKADVARTVRYMCAVTHDALTNASKCVLLKTSSAVVTQECVDKLVRKDMTDPVNGKALTDADIVPFRRGGTGFATTNDQLEAKSQRPVPHLQ